MGGAAWYFRNFKSPLVEKITPASTLGGQIYEQANNPIQDKLPDTVAPVANPIQDAYKNPFE